jgi:hypothetical protein
MRVLAEAVLIREQVVLKQTLVQHQRHLAEAVEVDVLPEEIAKLNNLVHPKLVVLLVQNLHHLLRLHHLAEAAVAEEVWVGVVQPKNLLLLQPGMVPRQILIS